eukprot:scaffold2353_cov167-Amphora_coffeaeformis.AAC.69
MGGDRGSRTMCEKLILLLGWHSRPFQPQQRPLSLAAVTLGGMVLAGLVGVFVDGTMLQVAMRRRTPHDTIN